MQIIAKRTLMAFWTQHPRAEWALRDWHMLAGKAQWNGPEDVRKAFGKGVDFIGDNRIIFDIRRNEFRLIVHAAYAHKRLLIKFAGTHAQYDRIDPETV